MQNVPKIVKERLQSAAIAAEHPDANVLSAFSERTLADQERSRVMEHLARCGECREVVALALPLEETGLAVVHPSQGSWLSWPRLRWGLVAASVIVVGSFTVLRYERAKGMGPVALESPRIGGISYEAKEQASPLPARSDEARDKKSMNSPAVMSPDLAGKSQIDENEKKFELVAKSQAPRDDKPATGNRATSLHGQQLSHGPMPPSQWQQNLNANTANQRMMFQQVPAPPAPAANELSAAVTVSAQSSPAAAPAVGGLMPEKQVQKFDTLAMNARSAAPLPSTRASTGAEVARAKDAEPPANAPKAQATGAYDVSESSTSNFSPSGSLVAESARWTINSMGGLQRSFDQGKTWQSVDVANSVQDSSGMNLQLAMKTARAKPTAKEKADEKTKPIVFRAVAANGPDVWAGGSESTLFHSMDSGDHWIRIQPSWRGVQLSGDILSLQFADPQHGRIVTSTAEIWNTADAGQTWDKQ